MYCDTYKTFYHDKPFAGFRFIDGFFSIEAHKFFIQGIKKKR